MTVGYQGDFGRRSGRGHRKMNKEEQTPEIRPEQIEVEKYADSEAGANPIAGGLNLLVSVPETIEIKMVNAAALEEYEIWFFISSVLANFAAGFAVAFFASGFTLLLAVNTSAFVILLGISVLVTLRKRKRVQTKSRSLKFKATQIARDV